MSIRNLGTPLTYQQNFNVTYNVPLDRIPFLDWINLDGAYNSQYNWNVGPQNNAQIYLGNNITNSSQWSVNGGLRMETLYNKSKYLKTVNQKFTARARNTFSLKSID